MSTEITVIPQEFTTAIARISDGVADSASIAAKFAPHYVAFHDAAADAMAIREDQPAAARAMRLRLRAIRVASEKTRKDEKDSVLRRGKAIDGYHAILEDALVPVEKALDDIEKAEARREAERKDALANDRREQLLPYCDPTHYALGDMPAPQFASLLAGQKAAKAAADEAAAQAERERVAAAEKAAAEAEAARLADIAERKRLADEAAAARAAAAEAERVAAVERATAEAERVRLAAEQAEKDRLARIEADRVAAANAARMAALKADRDRIEAAAKAERDRLAAEHAAALAEQKRKQDAADAAAAAERDRLAAEAAKAASEAARLAKAEADRVAEAERVAATAVEAAKKAERAPDREKLLAFAAALAAVPVPVMATSAASWLAGKIAPEVLALCDRIRTAAEKL